ncbi:hypothetical protein UVI_02010610 [Ustilaginoidea virens]|uniref:Uncharacterized protein n=1 Tax=Ustilaginoidea virens TaxID=1159556 RepID=A0A1B5KWI6_USTVR|nr:hypothetical protein UVI_02010610 [Ustilaginoidea virens]
MTKMRAVVVGTQSGGESSLLEGVTGLSFSVASDLGTRFAAQAVLHQAPDEKLSAMVSAAPGPSILDDEARKERLLEFAKQMDADELSGSESAWMLDGLFAAEYMALPSSDVRAVENLAKRFSDDIPRILRTRSTSFERVRRSRAFPMTHRPAGIRNHCPIPAPGIKAVIDAGNNPGNQEFFRMVRAADPTGNRPVGIIIKCEALQPGDKDGPSPWNALPKGRVGAKALKPFLGQLLMNSFAVKGFEGFIRHSLCYRIGEIIIALI